jgi:NDP-sugar pyrophosphorylase family protein
MSFRQFGGLTYASKHNIVSSNYNSQNNVYVPNCVGAPGTLIKYLSNLLFGGEYVTILGNAVINGSTNIGGDAVINGSTNIGGNVVINGSTNVEDLTVLGNFDFSGNLSLDYLTVNNITAGSFTTMSDYRIKENVVSLHNTNLSLHSLNPVMYHNTQTNRTDMGFIAHEIQEHIPMLVHGEKDNESLQSVNYIGLIPLLVKEIQSLRTEIIALKEQINK